MNNQSQTRQAKGRGKGRKFNTLDETIDNHSRFLKSVEDDKKPDFKEKLIQLNEMGYICLGRNLTFMLKSYNGSNFEEVVNLLRIDDETRRGKRGAYRKKTNQNSSSSTTYTPVIQQSPVNLESYSDLKGVIDQSPVIDQPPVNNLESFSDLKGVIDQTPVIYQPPVNNLETYSDLKGVIYQPPVNNIESFSDLKGVIDQSPVINQPPVNNLESYSDLKGVINQIIVVNQPPVNNLETNSNLKGVINQSPMINLKGIIYQAMGIIRGELYKMKSVNQPSVNPNNTPVQQPPVNNIEPYVDRDYQQGIDSDAYWGEGNVTLHSRNDYSSYHQNDYQSESKTGGCFDENVTVLMPDDSFRKIIELKKGDFIKTGSGKFTRILRVVKYDINEMKYMCTVGDTFITRGHPILIKGDWYRGDELFQTKFKWQNCVYNFELESEHTIVIGDLNEQYIAATLGLHCPRIAKLWPKMDDLYGNGYKGSE